MDGDMYQIVNNPRILFVNPPSLRLVSLKDPYTTPFPYVPYGSLYLATFLEKHGFKTRVFNADFNIKNQKDNDEEEIWNEVKDAISSYQPDVLGISVRSLQYKSALKTAEIAKNLNEDTIVIVGGWHPSFLYRDLIDFKFIDFVVIREGEITTLDLLNKLINAGDLSQVNGIVYKKN